MAMGVAGALAVVAAPAAAAEPEVARPGKAAPLPPPPVSIRVVAPSPDPAWTLRIDNEGDEPVRIAADVRLLSIEIAKAGTRVFRPCRPAPGQQPSSFPSSRELYLAPGESWVEPFDPRLFCFGAEGDLLRGGTVVRFKFGFDTRHGRKGREPFVVQGTRAPAAFAPQNQLVLPTIVLSHAAGTLASSPQGTPGSSLQATPASPPPGTPAGVSFANAPLPKVPPPRDEPRRRDADGRHHGSEGRHGPDGQHGPDGRHGESAHHGAGAPDHADGPESATSPDGPPRTGAARARATAEEAIRLERERERERQRQRERELATTYGEPPEPEHLEDRMAPDLDLYVERWATGGAPRDLVLRIRAENEGGRALSAVLRSRMLRFRVEGPLAADNRTTATSECLLDERSHAVPVEMVRNLRPGDRQDFPFLLAEVCPRGTFDRPGLYRVTPLLQATIEGEAVEDRDAFQGRVRALQPALARVGSSKLPFYDAPPRAVATARLRPRPDGEDDDDADGSEEADEAPSGSDEQPAAPAPPAP